MNKKLKKVLDSFKGDNVPLVGKWTFEITRANGDIEKHTIENTMIATGLDLTASMLTSNAQSAFLYLAIGTVTDESSLGSAKYAMGEVSRKIAATATSSKEVAILVATWAGNADSISGVPLASGGTYNHVNSGFGEVLNVVNSVDATLQDSDFLKIQMEVQVGSHNL